MTVVEMMRVAFKAYQAFSGMSPTAFKRSCESLLHEKDDGEYEGEPRTPGQWLQVARERAWEHGTNCGRNKKAEAAFLKLDADVWGKVAA